MSGLPIVSCRETTRRWFMQHFPLNLHFRVTIYGSFMIRQDRISRWLNKEVAMHEANTKYSFSRGLCRKSQWAPLSNCFLRGTHACPFEDQSRGPSCGSTIRNPVGSAFNGHKLSDAYMVLLGIYVYLWVLNPTTSNLKAATSALAISMGIPMPLIWSPLWTLIQNIWGDSLHIVSPPVRPLYSSEKDCSMHVLSKTINTSRYVCACSLAYVSFSTQ